jgi:ABC-type glutathione transport system ATPase component
MTVLDIVGEPLRIHGLASGRQLEDRVAQTLERVGLRPEYMRRYPHAFSGGQRQRIGIARALYKQASVLVFDEATSALDSATEQSVMSAIEGLDQELTILMIAHRLTTVRNCDTIVQLEAGKLVAQGTYEELLASSPSFQRMALAASQEPVLIP